MEEDMEDSASDEEEEEEEEEEQDCSFTAYEIDIDYEFDAARFFDFGREESPLDACHAEAWFDSARSYPPSPFVARLVPGGENFMENVGISPKSKCDERMDLSESYYVIEVENKISTTGMHYRADGKNKGASSHVDCQQKFPNPSHKLPSGVNFNNYMGNRINSEMSFSKSTSTLMKPTVSQLAKQNHTYHPGSRSHMSVLNGTSKNSTSTCVVENQAAKRQKLEGGLLRKVVGAQQQQQQQPSFAHKAPKRDGFLDGNVTHTKLRITIPRDPILATAHRAQRTREKSSNDENVISTVRRFKARPLNKKILEAPTLIPKRSAPRLPDFQEFHLKTSERAVRHGPAILKSRVSQSNSDKDLHKHHTADSTAECGSREPGRALVSFDRSNLVNNVSRLDSSQPSHSFKPLTLNNKILTGNGIFGNSKKEATVPMEFNFQQETRHHPPIELFNKLSLVSETGPVAKPELKGKQPIRKPQKVSKENRRGFFHRGNEMKQYSKWE